MLIDLRPKPLLPPGSLIQTTSKFGHELIAGPMVGNRQVVGHSEPGMGTHVEWMDNAAQRYQFTAALAPVNDHHASASWRRLAQQVGEPWAVGDNCQHTAREAYFGIADSPTVNGIAVGAGALLLLLLANRD